MDALNRKERNALKLAIFESHLEKMSPEQLKDMCRLLYNQAEAAKELFLSQKIG